jgi:membrane protein DedA with SNARE-associated domain
MWLLFALVFVNQGGIPIPVVPSLLMAGARTGTGPMGLVTTALEIVAASLAADLVWYGVGRWRGRQARALVGRISGRTAARVELAERRFRAHRIAFLLGARFLPELNPLAAGMAGATGMTLRRFVVIATTSALVWAAVWVGTGYVLGPVAAGIPPVALLTTLGLVAIAIGVASQIRSGSLLPSPQPSPGVQLERQADACPIEADDSGG